MRSLFRDFVGSAGGERSAATVWWSRARSFTTSVVTGASHSSCRMRSWPTQSPTCATRSTFRSLSKRACATGLQMAAKRSG